MRDKKYDLLSVDLGWVNPVRRCEGGGSNGVKSHEGENFKNLTRVALSFLDFKNREILCIYKPHLSCAEFLFHLRYLKAKSTILLDIPLKGKTDGFFRPVERLMQRIGLPCRPSKEALVKGKKFLSKIEALGFKAIEIYPYGFYKFYCLLSTENSDPSWRRVSMRQSCRLVPTRRPNIDSVVFRRFFPPYKSAGEKGLKNAEKIIKQFLELLKLKLVRDRKLKFKNYMMKWDIYDSLFGVIAGYLLLKHSPWIKIIRDKTGSEILILADGNIGHFFDIHTGCQ